MPLINHSNLPAFQRLADEGEIILSKSRASHQDIRELHIGLLNMMPDAALEATERQFFRLVGSSNQIAQFYLHPFTLPTIKRGKTAAAHIKKYYPSADEIKAQGLDALIITGAHVENPDLKAAPFYDDLKDIIHWAYENVTSTLCSCLATHAVLAFRYRQNRRALPAKYWGVYRHRVVRRDHPLVANINTRFDVPHSRFNEISEAQFHQAGLVVLAKSERGVHLALSADLLRLVFFQGHPEYDTISLMKEYKREVSRFIDGARDDYPPFPQHYFGAQAQAILNEYKNRLVEGALTLADFPEKLIAKNLHNTWGDTTRTIINNWVGCVYQVTDERIDKPFMAGVDPEDPLNLKS